MENLKVIKFKDGSLVKDSKTAGTVFFRVECAGFKSGSSLLVETTTYGQVRMKKTTFERLGITEGCNLNEVYAKFNIPAHKIYVKESITPQYDSHQPKVNPSKNNEVVVNASGQPIYYNTEVLIDSPENKDVFIPSASAASIAASASVEVI